MTTRRRFLAAFAGAAGLGRPETALAEAAFARQTAEGPRGLLDARTLGAVGDGVADDTRPIQAALDQLGPSGGGIVLVAAGTYVISDQLSVPSNVRLVGLGSRATVLKASRAFPTDTAMVRLGTNADLAFSCGVEQLMLECDHVDGSSGIYSTDLQENGAVSEVVVNSYRRHGVFLDGTRGAGISNFRLANLELAASAAADGSTGIEIHGGSWKNRIENVSVVPHRGAAPQSAGVRVREGKLNAHGVHVENHNDAVHFGGGTHGSLSDVDGEMCANLIRLNTAGRVLVLFAFRSGGRTLLLNERLEHALTEGATAFYAQDGGASAHVVTSSHTVATGLGSVRFSDGATISGLRSGTSAWSPPNLSSGEYSTADVVVNGATLGDTVAVGYSGPLPRGVLLCGAVSAPGVISVTLLNATDSMVGIAPGVIRADAWRIA